MKSKKIPPLLHHHGHILKTTSLPLDDFLSYNREDIILYPTQPFP